MPPPSSEEIRVQIQRLEQSPAFLNSERLMLLLRHLVDTQLQPGAPPLKEASIGNALYGRNPPYDPRIDSTVRVEAARLRRKLKEYYAGPGQHDEVHISLPTGGYTPRFERRAGPAAPLERSGEPGNIFSRGTGTAVAIMPLRALSADPEDQIFADGLTDELIFAMGRVPGWRIVSSSITFQYRDRAYTPAELAQQLSIDALLQGTVRRDGERLRVTIEVSDPQGFAVWSHRFDALATDRLALQERITATTVSRVQSDSSPMRAMQVSPGPGALEKAATIFRARQLLDEQSPAALWRARDLFSQVAATTPDYARGHSGLADVYCDLYRLALIDHASALSAARQAVDQGTGIDPRSLEIHAARAVIAGWLEWDRREAERLFEIAFELGDNARCARLYGVFLTFLERHGEVARQFQQARALEPISVHQDIAEAICHFQARRFDQLAHLGADHPVPAPEVIYYQSLAGIFAGKTALDPARLEPLEHAGSRQPDLYFARAELDAWQGQGENGRRLLDAHASEAAPGHASHFAQATLAAALGDATRCCNALAAALAARELAVVWLRTDPRFDKLRQHAHFRTLLAELDRLQVRDR